MRTLSLKLLLAVAGVIVLFILVSLAQEMNRRLQVQREVARLEQEVQEMEKTIIEMENLNQYFRTDAFQELMARQKLNYSRPGETVVLLPDTSEVVTEVVQQEIEQQEIPVPQRWWNVFFSREE